MFSSGVLTLLPRLLGSISLFTTVRVCLQVIIKKHTFLIDSHSHRNIFTPEDTSGNIQNREQRVHLRTSGITSRKSVYKTSKVHLLSSSCIEMH